MISPHTPAGTRIAFIRTPLSIVTNKRSSPFDKGDEVTLIDIFPMEKLPSGYAAAIEEHYKFYCLSLFRRVELPKSLTDCLEVVDLPLIIDEFKRQDADADARLLMPY